MVPPEFIVFKPSSHNNFRWIVEFYDPPTQGLYKTISFDASTPIESIKISIKNVMEYIENELI